MKRQCKRCRERIPWSRFFWRIDWDGEGYSAPIICKRCGAKNAIDPKRIKPLKKLNIGFIAILALTMFAVPAVFEFGISFFVAYGILFCLYMVAFLGIMRLEDCSEDKKSI